VGAGFVGDSGRGDGDNYPEVVQLAFAIRLVKEFQKIMNVSRTSQSEEEACLERSLNIATGKGTRHPMKICLFKSRFLYVFCLVAFLLTAAFADDNNQRACDIVKALKSPDADLAYKTAKLISKMDEKTRVTLINPLIEALKEDDNRARANVGDGLANIGPKAVPDLIKSLSHKDARVRQGSAFALEVLGLNADISPALPALVQTMQDPKREVRAAVASALGHVDNEAAVAALIKLARTDEYWLVKVNAINSLQSLGRHHAKQAIPALIELFRKQKFGDWFSTRGALVSYGSDSVPSLLEVFQDQTLDKHVRLGALQMLAEIGPGVKEVPSAITVLRGVMKHSVEDFRTAAIFAIGCTNAKEAIPDLERILTDKSPLVRMEAAQALYEITPDNRTLSVFVNTLVQSLKLDNNEIELVAWILQIRPQTLPIALRAIHEFHIKGYERRFSALNRLDSLGPKAKAAIPVLIQMLHEKDQVIRSGVESAFVSIGPDALPALKKASLDKDLTVQTAAKDAIEVITSRYHDEK
jgi:HEAT repeat protein